MPALLPLRDGGHIICGNSLRLNWEDVCPFPSKDEELFIAGNPPFLGTNFQSREQKSDFAVVFDGHVKSYAAFDFVAAWFFKSSQYIRGKNAQAALVSTNSICQGYSVFALWPHVLDNDLEIKFTHRNFKWRNNASANADVMCSIIGLRNKTTGPKKIFRDDTESLCSNINSYLVSGPDVYIGGSSISLFGLPEMIRGNQPTDGGHLILSDEEAASLINESPAYKCLIRKFKGSQEVVDGSHRYCLWIPPDRLQLALQHPDISKRIADVKEFRLNSTDAYVREKLAVRPHTFKQTIEAETHAILVPCVSSERRPYLPVDRVNSDVVSSNLNQVLYDAPDWCIAIISSRLHLVWIGTVCGKLKSDFRYSNTLGWNTFPVPKFTPEQLGQLTASARKILKTRYQHYPKSIADC